MLYSKSRYQSRRNNASAQSEASTYEPHWAFLLDGNDKVSRMNPFVAYVVSSDATGDTVPFTMNGMPFGDVTLTGMTMMTVEDIEDAVTTLVGKANVTSKFLSNGQKLVRNGDKVATGVDQLCMTICNDIWVDAVIANGGPNAPTGMMSEFGNVFFFVRTKVNSFDIGGQVCTEWREFLDVLSQKFDALKAKKN